jgi:hypothetical protein
MMNPRVKDVQILDNYRLLLTFTNNEKKVFDVKPYLSTGIFKELQNTETFNSVRALDGTIQWMNEADFCPDTLYLESQILSSK